MLFNSIPFIFVFLPVAVILFHGLARASHRAAAGFLVIASLFFYGWWDSRYVLLLVASTCGNFLFSEVIVRARTHRKATAVLAMAITADLAVLAYYKYANFFVTNFDVLTGLDWTFRAVILPLGISFYTFTQIAFLVDVYRNEVRERDFIHYLLFVTYFPHLIAGPILHHAEMMPQFAKRATYRLSGEHAAVGLSLFILGLVKKTICADGIAPVAQRVFAAAGNNPIDLFHAWYGVLAYTMQIYFDFSAYSDMAVGISFLFGIRLPLNFDSPYKAVSIIDFWRRWHMTLSRFLRDYLYIPLGGSRCSPPRRYANLLITMLLGGLWHGAAWTYVIWGGLHGIYLMINHLWRRVTKGLSLGSGMIARGASLLITFLAVVVAWVFFRADSFSAAMAMLKSMAGLNGIEAVGAVGRLVSRLGIASPAPSPYVSNLDVLCLALLTLLCWIVPNAYQMLGKHSPALQTPAPSGIRVIWRPNAWWAAGLGVLGALSLCSILSGVPSEFIYFQF
jgi:D-alanyl-lipoteichoic acid acyltransferase DltB (MBOAT superfamily)